MKAKSDQQHYSEEFRKQGGLRCTNHQSEKKKKKEEKKKKIFKQRDYYIVLGKKKKTLRKKIYFFNFFFSLIIRKTAGDPSVGEKNMRDKQTELLLLFYTCAPS